MWAKDAEKPQTLAHAGENVKLCAATIWKAVWYFTGLNTWKVFSI